MKKVKTKKYKTLISVVFEVMAGKDVEKESQIIYWIISPIMIPVALMVDLGFLLKNKFGDNHG